MLRSRHPVLVVDDHQATREAIQRLLRFHGYSVITTSDAQEALEYLEAGGEVCAMVLDLDMPRMDALTFRERQMADPALSGIPVIVFTGLVADPLPGVAGIVRKTDPDTLLALLDRCLLRSSGTTEA